MELNKVYCEDSEKELKKLESRTIDLILTDPPYGINYVSNRYKDKNDKFDEIVDDNNFMFEDFINDNFRLLTDKGCMLIFFPWNYNINNPKIKNILIWVKNKWTSGNLYSNFGYQYEKIAFVPNKKFKLCDKRCGNVMNFSRVVEKKLLHPTQKPLELIKKLILMTTNEGDLVLDPYTGSGTILLGSIELNRRFLGYEIERKYYDITNKRINEYVPINNMSRWM